MKRINTLPLTLDMAVLVWMLSMPTRRRRRPTTSKPLTTPAIRYPITRHQQSGVIAGYHGTSQPARRSKSPLMSYLDPLIRKTGFWTKP